MYAISSYCQTDANPLPNSITTAGGTFTINNGGVINSSTGEVNLGSTSAGTYTITYTTTGTCPDLATFNITIGTGGTIVLEEAGPFCETVLNVNLVSNLSGGTWSGIGIVDATTGEFSPSTAGVGTHTITYTITGDCGSSETIDIIVNAIPIVTVTPSVTMDFGTSVLIEATGDGNFSWTPSEGLSCDDCAVPVANPILTTTYCVTLNKSGCIDTACTTVTVDYNCGEVFIPNAFSPNGDGANNLECVYGNCIVQMDFKIYDRWGELVFRSNELNRCWDGTYKGKELVTQVFVYTLTAKLITGESIKRNGNITLIK